MAITQKISPNLWFDRQAEEAVNFYLSIFEDSRILRSTRYGKEGHEIHKMPEGTIMSIEFELEGQKFVALNGGPIFKFNEAISFIIHCENQEEIDYYWEKLSHDKSAEQCGWLKDKFGLSWQIIPNILSDSMTDSDREKSTRVMHAMMQMKKLDIQQLKDAYNGQ